MEKDIRSGEDVKNALKSGVDILADSVKVTLGARGRYVMNEDKHGNPHPTKDGYTVAKEIFCKDRVENMAARLVAQAARKVADDAGDATTTATILTQAIFNGGLKAINSGANFVDIKEGIEAATKEFVTYLNNSSEKIKGDIKKIRQVATISANGDTVISGLITQAIEKVGWETVITPELSKNGKTYIDVVEGMEFPEGYRHPFFVTNPVKMTVEMEDPFIYLLDGKLAATQTVMEMLKQLFDKGQNTKGLVIIARDFEGDILSILAANKVKNNIPVVAVRVPYTGVNQKEFLYDISAVTGARVISDESGVGFETFSRKDLGVCKKIVIKKDSTAIIGSGETKTAVDVKVQELQHRMEEEKDPNVKSFLKNRIARLSGGVGILYYGAGTEAESKALKDQIDDAIAATKSAIEEGIIAGGGVALVQGIATIDFDNAVHNEDQRSGMKVVAEAVKEPILQIIRNAGKENPETVLENVMKGKVNHGFDVMKREYVDMKKAGIIDPKKATRLALETASSVANLLLTTEVTVTNMTY